MSSGRSPERLAAILSHFGDVADEIVVAVEEPRAHETHAAVAHVADRVLSFPPVGPADRQIAWLFGACSGRWILNIDDDEVPSPSLIDALPSLIARDDITHAWIARRWLYPTTATYLDEAPWNTEFQLRLLLADERFVQFSDVFHRPVIAHGPGVYVEEPLWHLDAATNPLWRRRAKAGAYEMERPGMTIAGRAHNHALYVPELTPNAVVTAVPSEERARIDAAVAGHVVPTRTTVATLVQVTTDDVDAAWVGGQVSTSLHRGRVAAAVVPGMMRAGVQETVGVYVTNESNRVWRWGKDARPEIRLAYHWSLDGEHVRDEAALRTQLPADLRPGATQFVPVHVVPPRDPGRYALHVELLHEGVVAFASASPVEIEVRERELLAVLGKPDDVARLLAMLAPPPTIEPVVVLGNDSDRSGYGDYGTVSGLRTPLLAGLESSGRLARAVKLLARTLGIVRGARRYRRSGVSYDVRLVGLFGLLQQSRALVVAGTDWPDDAAPGREWWRLVATLLTCRAAGRAAYVREAAVPTAGGMRGAVLRRLILRNSRPLSELRLGDVLSDATHPASDTISAGGHADVALV